MLELKHDQAGVNVYKPIHLENAFDKKWTHFDVTKDGKIDVIKIPQFKSFHSSDIKLLILNFKWIKNKIKKWKQTTRMSRWLMLTFD